MKEFDKDFIPVSDRYILSVEQAAEYFHISSKKLRQIISSDEDADYLLWVGSRPLIKKGRFEKFIDRTSCI